MFCRLEEIKT